MKLFLKRILYFIFLALLLISFFSFLRSVIIKNESKDFKAIYIWGDSQTYRGIDLKLLSKKTNRKCYSLAIEGAGVYDFMVFTEKVPSYSQVIVSLSKPAQIRNKLIDFNRSGFSFKAIYTLYKNNYSIQELIEIFKNNKNLLFSSYSSLYPYNDSIIFSEPLSIFREGYKTVPNYLLDKQNIYLEGIKKLKEKKCKIIFIEFPFHSILREIEDKSPIKVKTQNFNKRVIKLFDRINIDTFDLNNNKQKMHDLTHMNELGAKEVSESLFKIMNSISRKEKVDFLVFRVKN
jgi:hypothetical protein